VIRHDLIAADFRDHRRRACCATCRKPDCYADRGPQSRLQIWPTNKPDLLLAPRTPTGEVVRTKMTLRISHVAVVRAVLPARRSHYSHSARTTAASFNRATMRSCSRSRPETPPRPRPHRTSRVPQVLRGDSQRCYTSLVP
jgi:hypothetical protein